MGSRQERKERADAKRKQFATTLEVKAIEAWDAYKDKMDKDGKPIADEKKLEGAHLMLCGEFTSLCKANVQESQLVRESLAQVKGDIYQKIVAFRPICEVQAKEDKKGGRRERYESDSDGVAAIFKAKSHGTNFIRRAEKKETPVVKT